MYLNVIHWQRLVVSSRNDAQCYLCALSTGISKCCVWAGVCGDPAETMQVVVGGSNYIIL